jgi:hypothetical protein
MGYSTAHSKDHSIWDLFFEIPADLLGFYSTTSGKILPTKEWSKRVLVKDLGNGYLEFDGKGLDGLESKIQVALFKTQKRRSLILVAYHLGDSTDDLRAFRKDKGVWRDVSQEVLPKIEPAWVNQRTRERVPEAKSKKLNLDDCASGTFEYLLPQKGRTIQVRTSSDCLTVGNGRLIFEVVPDGEAFKKK